jgi:excinuclease ABC subunit A
VECDTCHGARYNPETLAVRYHERSIADVLKMRVGEALELFGNIPKIRNILQTLSDVGLDYLALGQAAPTLSGGEAQRVKLAAELSRPSTGKTLYLLDEPTTGLHFDDIRKLLDVLHRLVDLGNTVITVEHNLDVVKTADWVIDLGPEAGNAGGRVVANGTPEDIVAEAKKPEVISHTGQILANVLKAGPYLERKKFDPEAALAARVGDVDLEKVGKDSKLPWQVDGVRWHTQDRVTTKGQQARWEGKILTWINEKIHELGDFAETNWNERTIVEITGPSKSKGWFFHGQTGMEWLVRLVFRVGRNTFKQQELSNHLRLKPLDQMEGLQVYGRESRVQVANRKGPWQEVWMLIHKLDEIETPQFEEFLKQAVAAFHKNLQKMATTPEDVMPWKVNGERWHLSEKGFPPGRKIHWDRALLPHMLEILKSVEPELEIRWDTRDSINIKVPEVSFAWCRIRTKDPEFLDCRFVGKKGQFNLSQVEGLGKNPTLTQGEKSEGGDILRLYFQKDAEMPVGKLKSVLKEHLQGFREAFSEKE